MPPPVPPPPVVRPPLPPLPIRPPPINPDYRSETSESRESLPILPINPDYVPSPESLESVTPLPPPVIRPRIGQPNLRNLKGRIFRPQSVKGDDSDVINRMNEISNLNREIIELERRLSTVQTDYPEKEVDDATERIKSAIKVNKKRIRDLETNVDRIPTATRRHMLGDSTPFRQPAPLGQAEREVEEN